MNLSSIPFYRRPRAQIIAAVVFALGVAAAPLMSLTDSSAAPQATPPVLNLSVTQAFGTLTATWTAPQGILELALRHANARSPHNNGYQAPTSYTCTLMYGFGIPSSYSETSTTTSCSFSGLGNNTTYGIGVVANYTYYYGYYNYSSVQVTAFPQAVTTTTVAGSTSATTTSTSTTTTWPSQPKRTITCVKGKITKKVTAVAPTCPAGYKLKK